MDDHIFKQRHCVLHKLNLVLEDAEKDDNIEEMVSDIK